MLASSLRMPWHACIIASLLALVITVTAGAAGVQRRLTIHTNPPGALVKVDDNEIGMSPVSASFIYYGTRKIQIIKPGFETLTVLQPIRMPWYELPGLDFFSEHVIPGERRDVRVLTFNLQPKVTLPTDQLLARAEALRRNGQASAFAPARSAIAVPANNTLPVAPPAVTNPPFVPPNNRHLLVPPGPALPRPLPPAERLPAPGNSRLPF